MGGASIRGSRGMIEGAAIVESVVVLLVDDVGVFEIIDGVELVNNE